MIALGVWAALSVAEGAPIEHRRSLKLVFKHCGDTATQCDGKSDRVPGEGWDALQWYLRREFAAKTYALSETRSLGWHRDYCERSGRRNDCLLAWLETNHPGWAHLACEAGDVGSCLLDALELPPSEAHARLADLCRRGAANACAWHAEVSLRTDAALAGPFAMTQRACLELQEPVACAAAGKVAGAKAMPEQSAFWHQTACDWGYVPSCDVEDRNTRTLAEEAPPAVVGPSMLKPDSLEPLPGRPALPR